MGITPLTLALASLRNEKILDHKTGKMAYVRIVGHIGRQPVYVLEYENKEKRPVLWQDGQGIAGDVILEQSTV